MAKKRKLICECEGTMEELTIVRKRFSYTAMVCNSCKKELFNLTQAKEYSKLIRLHKLIDGERKIIKIGNSMGITLPEQLKEFGVKIGKKIKTKVLSSNSFEIRF